MAQPNIEGERRTAGREAFLSEISNIINATVLNHPLRVAIDGVDTSGKTTLADELVAPLKNLGRPIIRASIDKFHRPRNERYQKGRNSPEGYYQNSFNYDAFIRELLSPLGENGKAYRTAFFDFRTDAPVISEQNISPDNAILLCDGVFLLRPEINNYWDLRIFLHVPFDTVLERAKTRDAELLGGSEEVERLYRERYIPGQQIYLHSVHPERIADIVIDNTDYNKPYIISSKLPI